MYVIAHHRITDPEGFRQWTEEPVAGRPIPWRLILFAPTRGGSVCFCLWSVDLAEALQLFLDRCLSDVGTVECHEVDEESALGLVGTASTRVEHLRCV